jgi:oxaloacetate decarboxylase beta subunit
MLLFHFFLGPAVGSKLQSEQFLVLETLVILPLGIAAFAIGTATVVLTTKLMNRFSKQKLSSLISAGSVPASPMAPIVISKVGLDANPENFLLMHAMGPYGAGVIG